MNFAINLAINLAALTKSIAQLPEKILVVVGQLVSLACFGRIRPGRRCSRKIGFRCSNLYHPFLPPLEQTHTAIGLKIV